MLRSRPSTDSTAHASLLTTLAAAALLAAAGPGTPIAAAEHAGGTATFVAEQGDRCVPLEPVGDGTTNVSSFYDYRSGPGTEFSSYGTRDLQRSNASQVFLYHGTEGLSLVFLHDELAADGGGGGAVSVDLDGLPDDGRWVVRDDSYGGEDDRFLPNGSADRVDWMWAPNRTDGGAFRGLDRLGEGEAVVVNATIGRGSYGHARGWPYATDRVEWVLRTGSDDVVSLTDSRSLVLRRGTCAEGPAAALAVGTSSAAVGTDVALNASGSSAGAGIAEYRWDFRGDGTVDAVTDEPRVVHAFDRPGSVEPTVTVVDANGKADAAAVDLEVTDDTPPVARITRSATTVGVGEPVTFGGARSGDDGTVERYEWAFGDGATATGPTATHAYDAPGTYETTLRVGDAAGNENATAVTVTVVDETSPTPALEAPDVATTGESIAFDAANSTDAHAIASYEWAFGDGATATGPTPTHAYDAPGTYDVSVTVTDASGNAATAEATVTVEQRTTEGDTGAPATPTETPGTPTATERPPTETETATPGTPTATPGGGNGDGNDGGDDDSGDGSTGDDDTGSSDGDGSDASDANDGDDDSAQAAPGDGGSDEGNEPNLSVDRTSAGDVAVSLANGRAGERVRADLGRPANAEAALTGLAIAPAADGDLETTMRASNASATPNDTARGLLELDPASRPDVDRVEYAFVVGNETGDVSPSALGAYEVDGDGWRRLATNASADGSGVRVEATSDRLARVVLATRSTGASSTATATATASGAGSSTGTHGGVGAGTNGDDPTAATGEGVDPGLPPGTATATLEGPGGNGDDRSGLAVVFAGVGALLAAAAAVSRWT